jgi:hypothetical protein
MKRMVNLKSLNPNVVIPQDEPRSMMILVASTSPLDPQQRTEALQTM